MGLIKLGSTGPTERFAVSEEPGSSNVLSRADPHRAGLHEQSTHKERLQKDAIPAFQNPSQALDLTSSYICRYVCRCDKNSWEESAPK